MCFWTKIIYTMRNVYKGAFLSSLKATNLTAFINVGLSPNYDRKLKVYKKPEIKKNTLAESKAPSIIVMYLKSS